MNQQLNKYDVLIIGAGPAGLTCGIYCARANLKVAIIDKGAPGGKMTQTFNIENWIGDISVKGYELSQRMFQHAKHLGVETLYGEVVKVNTISEFDQEVYLNNDKVIHAKVVVIATGMKEKKPTTIIDFEKFENNGVSYCVTCDASFYKNLPAAIIGGGDSAFEEAIYLSSIASEVHIFIRKTHPKAEAGLVARVSKIENIKIHYASEILKLIGDQEGKLTSIEYVENDVQKVMNINHLYPYIGSQPSINFASHLDIFDSNNFIVVDESMETKVKGIYAIGDIRQKDVRQIITAASDGAIAGKKIANKLRI